MFRSSKGFTLIELMIVVAAIAILAAIALPSFNEQIRKSRRAQAVSAIGQHQLELERWRADHPSYAISGDHPLKGVDGKTMDHYSWAFTGDASGYTLTATPAGAQSGDRCGQLKATDDERRPKWATAACN